MGVHKISSFVRLSVYHLQVHLLFFRALCLSAPIIPSLFSHFLTVCLHICLSLYSSLSLLSVMSLLQRQKTDHPPHHDSITESTSSSIFLFSPLNVHLLKHHFSDSCLIRFQEAAQERRQSSLWLPFLRAPAKWWEQCGQWVRLL